VNAISSSKKNVLILTSVLVAALLFALYYYVILPKQQEVETLANTNTSLQSEISSIRTQMITLEEEKKNSMVNLFTLRKKVPANRDVEQMIRSIEEIETITGTRIESISFNNDTSVLDTASVASNAPAEANQTTTPANETAATIQQEAQSNGDTAGNAETATVNTTEQAPISTLAPESIPKELKLMTLSIDVLSPNFETLQQFIEEFEKMDRVVKVDTLDFSLPGEADFMAEDPELTVQSKIQITTFYYEDQQ